MTTVAFGGCREAAPPVTAVSIPVASAKPSSILTTPSPSAPEAREPDFDPALDTDEERAIGSVAPKFVLRGAASGAPDVELRAGRVTIVHFWATWCGPCKSSLPKLGVLYAKYRSQGLDVAAISVDDDVVDVAPFAKTYQVIVPVAWDPDHKVAERYRPRSMPSTYLIDRAGIVRFVHQGYHDGEEAVIDRELLQLL